MNQSNNSARPDPDQGATVRRADHKIVKGSVAEVYKIRAFVDEGWMNEYYATQLVRVRSETLRKWALAGLVSYRKDEADGQVRYLRAELLEVARMYGGYTRLTVRTIRRKLAEKQAEAGG